MLEVLTFDLCDETFAIQAGLVREIMDPLPETLVPGAAPMVRGVINFRGQVIPLADLSVALGRECTAQGADARVVVLGIDVAGETMLIAIRTERVNEVTSLNVAEAEAPPVLGLRWPRTLLCAVVRREDGVIMLPNLPLIFQSLVDGGADFTPAQA